MSASIIDITQVRAARAAAQAAALDSLSCVNPKGEIVVYPSDVGDGTWAVDHVSRSGDSAVRVGEWLSLDTALEFARMTAARTGADYKQRGDR